MDLLAILFGNYHVFQHQVEKRSSFSISLYIRRSGRIIYSFYSFLFPSNTYSDLEEDSANLPARTFLVAMYGYQNLYWTNNFMFVFLIAFAYMISSTYVMALYLIFSVVEVGFLSSINFSFSFLSCMIIS